MTGSRLHYALAVLAPAAATAVALLAFGRDQLPDVVMLYLLGIMLVSSRLGFAASLCAALLSVAAFNFFFVPPYLTFAVGDLRHATTFLVMFVVALVISGLTQRVRSQARAAEAARREVETEQLRSSLLSSVSHDLRTPLAVITGATSTLQQGGAALDEVTRQELLGSIAAQSERLNRLVGNLLDMTRLESGAVKVDKQWLSLEEVVGGALNHLEPHAAVRDIRVELPKDLPLVPGDEVLLQQVLINLLDNAAKYTSGEILVRAQARATEIVVEINDRGPGVVESDALRIFEKFQRGRQRARDGVGLGLAICRAIVTAHGGSIGVASRAGGGASFRFTLPLDGVPPPAPPSEPSESALQEQRT